MIDLGLEVVRWTLLEEGSLNQQDELFEVEPRAIVYEAFHRQNHHGWAVEVCDKNTGEKFLGFKSTLREAQVAALSFFERFEYPVFALKNFEVYAVRKSYGVFPNPIMEIEAADAWVRLNQHTVYE